MNKLKSLKQLQAIQELKIIRNAITEENKTYYNLEYEHNALANALAGSINPSQDESDVLDKYGQLITK